MPHKILGAPEPGPEILERIGRVASEWAWVESLLNECLAHFLGADHGSMYVLTYNVSNATVSGWLRTLTDIRAAPQIHTALIQLLDDIDATRAERNVVVHGQWWAHDEPGYALATTLRMDRKEVVRSELWSVDDLDALIDHIRTLQLALGNLGLQLGYFKSEPPEPAKEKE